MKLDIDGLHDLENKDIAKYIDKKLSALDKYIPRHARKSSHAEVRLREVKSNAKREYFCEVVLHVPGETITAKEATMNMFAAVDIVVEKLKVQVRKYKAKATVSHKNPIKRILHRIRTSQDVDE